MKIVLPPLVLTLTLAASLYASPAHASAQEELEATRKEIEITKQKEEALLEQNHKIETELKELQEKLVKTAESIQKGEFELSDAEEKLRILGEQLNEKNAALEARKKNLAALVKASLALSYTPPEAMLMMPGDITQALKVARVLKMTSDNIRAETQLIGLELAELNKLKDKISANRATIAAQQTDLNTAKKQLESRLSERKVLQDKLGREHQQETEKLQRLAKKAEDLKELVSSVSKEQEKRHSSDTFFEGRSNEAHRGTLRSFSDAKGHIRPPIAGQVLQSFGVKQGRNTTSKGILVAARYGAQVTAPYDGEVVFTGPFLNYGQLIIIRHSDDFHTLLAGLAKIDAVVGQFLLEGEPIGAMGDNASENRLYIELRKNNQPVDPAPWISGLNKKN